MLLSYRGRCTLANLAQCSVVCRLRHMKCDEGRPICSACMKSGRECRYNDANVSRYDIAPPFTIPFYASFSVMSFPSYVALVGPATISIAACGQHVAYTGR